jgi:acetyltransferase-like isoleucine patch superfamily enzyme
LETEGQNNHVAHGDNVRIIGKIVGNDNVVTVTSANVPSVVNLRIYGNNNIIHIGPVHKIDGLQILVGSHVNAHNTKVEIGSMFSIEPGCRFFLSNSRNTLTIGDDCMFSNAITIRCGELPHLIFNLETGAFEDVSDGVVFGPRVWVGEQAYFTKRAAVARGSIVAACSVVTKRYDEENVVLGGNPAKIIKRGVKWVRNPDMIERGSIYEKGYNDFLAGQNS